MIVSAVQLRCAIVNDNGGGDTTGYMNSKNR